MHSRNHRMFFAILPAVITVIALLLFVTKLVRYEMNHPVHTLHDDFTLEYDGRTYVNVELASLPDLIGHDLKKGETLTFSRKLDVEEVPSPTLELKVGHFAIEALLDGEFLGSYAMDRLQSGGYVGWNQQYVYLPAGYSGKTLTLIYHAAEPSLTPILRPLKVGDWHDLIHVELISNSFVLTIGIFLCFFGGFFLIFSLFFSALLPEIRGQRISSLITILTGIWMLTYYRATILFSRATHSMDIEYLCFFSILPLLYLLLWQIQPLGKTFRRIALANAAFVAVSFVLHFTNLIHIHRMRNIYYVLSSFFLFLLLKIDVDVIRKRNASVIDLLQLAGPTLFCVLTFLAMLSFLISGGEAAQNQSFARLLLIGGPLLLAIARFLIYTWMLMEMGPKRREFSALNEIAHIDGLTGLSNRARMSELFEELDQSPEDYCVVSLDLNGLKDVNDTLGHSMGDALLKSFANVLRATFSSEGTAMRIGGDEFLVVLDQTEKKRIQNDLDTLMMRFQELDAVSPDIPHSVACGFAFRNELPGARAHSVYLLADQRMYENKRRAKASAGKN